MAELSGKRIAFLATDMVEQVELTEPWQAVEEAGGQPELISLEEGEIQGFNHYDMADTFPVDRTVAEASADGYDGLVLPGGVGNPDTLRTDEQAVGFVREFVDSGKPVAVICHGPWTLVEADVVRGRTLTSWPSVKTDIKNAGGNWVDEEVVQDGNLTSSRKPDARPGVRENPGWRVGAGGAARRRRDARRHELPPHDRVVPGVPRARSGAADLADPPGDRDGWGPAGPHPRSRHRGRPPRSHRGRARRALQGAHRRGGAARGRERPAPGPEDARGNDRARKLVAARRARPLPRAARCAPACRCLDDEGQRRGDEARARPHPRRPRQGGHARRCDGRRHALGRRGRAQRGCRDRLRHDRRLVAAGAPRRRRRRSLREHRGAAPEPRKAAAILCLARWR